MDKNREEGNEEIKEETDSMEEDKASKGEEKPSSEASKESDSDSEASSEKSEIDSSSEPSSEEKEGSEKAREEEGAPEANRDSEKKPSSESEEEGSKEETCEVEEKPSSGGSGDDEEKGESSHSTQDMIIIASLVVGICCGIYLIFLQLKKIQQAGSNTVKVVRRNRPQDGEDLREKWKENLKKKVPLSQKVSKALAKGVDFMAREFLPMDKKKGGWHHFQWKKKKPGAPTTALALFALSSVPKKYVKKHEKTLHKGARFLISKMDERGAISEEDAHIQYRNYTTAMTLIALSQLDRKKYSESIEKIQKYLIDSQLTDLPRWNWHYGTWNYYETPHLGLRVDISVTSYVLEALKTSGLPPHHPVFKKAMIFLQRCQNFRDKGSSRAFDGGFSFHPRNSKAGAMTIQDGLTIYLSYGSATCDGLRSLIYTGYDLKNQRVEAAKSWIGLRFTVTRNPGFSEQDPSGIGRGIRFYYYHSLIKAIEATKAYEQNPEWVEKLAEYVVGLQRMDGSWANDTNVMSEDYPVIASSFSLLALGRSLPLLKKEEVKEKGEGE